MKTKISKRLEEIITALPITSGLRILEIGCGTGVVAREIVRRVDVYVLGIDRSAKAIEQCIRSSSVEIAAGKLQFTQTAIEDFVTEEMFDFAFAIRVGALDGRHPELQDKAFRSIAKVLKRNGKLFIDGGDPLQEIDIRKNT